MRKSLLTQTLELIPYGRVISYGECARMYSFLGGGSMSGWMMGRLLSRIPRMEWDDSKWRRVVAQTGMIVSLKLGEKGIVQHDRLVAEGIIITDFCVAKNFFRYFDHKKLAIQEEYQ